MRCRNSRFHRAFVFLPKLKRAGGHFGVRLVGAVGAAHDARLSAGGCAGIARAPGVEQGDAGAAFERCSAVQPPKAPAPMTAMWGFGFHERSSIIAGRVCGSKAFNR